MTTKAKENLKKLDADYEATLPGNKASTQDYYKLSSQVPDRFSKPDSFQGYGKRDPNPMYRTSANEYGCRQPTVHVMPQVRVLFPREKLIREKGGALFYTKGRREVHPLCPTLFGLFIYTIIRNLQEIPGFFFKFDWLPSVQTTWQPRGFFDFPPRGCHVASTCTMKQVVATWFLPHGNHVVYAMWTFTWFLPRSCHMETTWSDFYMVFAM